MLSDALGTGFLALMAPITLICIPEFNLLPLWQGIIGGMVSEYMLLGLISAKLRSVRGASCLDAVNQYKI
jgi:hypothetical protein